LQTKNKIEKIVTFLGDKKAKNIEVLDIGKLSVLTDYFIICSGTSTTHIKALADGLEKELLEEGIECSQKEGYNSARWILLDYDDVIVHIFHEQERDFYSLERLWSGGVMPGAQAGQDNIGI